MKIADLMEEILKYRDIQADLPIYEKAYLKDKVLRDVLSHSNAQILFGKVFERMSKKILEITEACLSAKADIDVIKQAAREVYECKMLLKDWSAILKDNKTE